MPERTGDAGLSMPQAGSRHAGLSIKAVQIILACSCLQSLFWLASGAAAENESFLRMLVGACSVFVAPGLAVGMLTRTRCLSVFETLAMAFLYSAIIHALFLPIALSLNLPASSALGAVLIGTLLLCIAQLPSWRLNLAPKRRAFLAWLEGRKWNWTDAAGVAFVGFLGVLAYRWGEEWFDMGNEKILHLMFARYYYSLPLSLGDLGIAKGGPPPNFVHFWEYLLALWAHASGMDILPVFARARCLVPVAGLSCMALLIRLTLGGARKTRIVFSVALALVALEIMLVAPSGLDWVNAMDPTRGLMCFLGTVHHADPAMDILLPMSLAACLIFLRRASLGTGLALAGALSVNFLWHPREFFQIALYFGLLWLLMLLAARNRLKALLRGALGMGVLVAVGIAFMALSSGLIGGGSQAYDETAIKKAALTQALDHRNILGVRNLLNAPIHFRLAEISDPKRIFGTEEMLDQIKSMSGLHYYWLILMALGIALIAVIGGTRDKMLGLYSLALLFFVLSWNFSMLLVTALTYSEFYMTTPRLIYLFAWLVIADSIYLVAAWALSFRIKLARAAFAASALGGCLLLSLLWLYGQNRGLSAIEWMLNSALLLSTPLLIYPLLSSKAAKPRLLPPYRACMALCLSMAACLAWMQIPKTARLTLFSRPEAKWFDDGNLFQYSKGLIGFIKSAPPKSVFFTDPRSVSPPFAYAPHYIAVFPTGAVMAHMNDLREIQDRKHPLLGAGDSFEIEKSDDELIHSWLSSRNVDFILWQKDNCKRLSHLLKRRPDLYSLEFENSGAEEAVFKVMRPDVRR